MDNETRQPPTGDVVLAQIMEKLRCNTPTDALHRVFELEDKVHFYEAPLPLLTVDSSGAHHSAQGCYRIRPGRRSSRQSKT